MEITNNIKEVLEGLVDKKLEEARRLSEKKYDELNKYKKDVVDDINKYRMNVLHVENAKFREWMKKNHRDVTFRYEGVQGFELNHIRDYDVFVNHDQTDPRDEYKNYRRDVLNKAVRIASENISKTAYQEVEKFLDTIDPVKDLNLKK